MERSLRVLLTLLALLAGLAAPTAQAGVRPDAAAGVEQVEAGGLAVAVMAASVAARNVPAAKRTWRGTEQRPLPRPLPLIVAAIERGDRALE